MPDVTRLLSAIDAGDPKAADQLLPLVYQELRKLAIVRMSDEKPGQTLQATALVHEAWLKIDGKEHFANRRHFFKAAALDLAPRTVDWHWAFARAWLKRTIRSSLSGPAGPD